MPLIVYWYLDQGLGCRFEKLFITPIRVRLIQSDLRTFFGKCREKLIKRLIKWAGGYTPTISKLENIEAEKDRIRKARITRIKSCTAFYGNGRFIQLFKPIPVLQATIDTYKEKLGAKAIGIHIRRTDHEEAIKFSPLEEFERVILQEIEANSQAVIYLATDDPQVETTLVSKFSPNRIITQKDKPFDRSNSEGIQAALIDFYCLANCCRIYGSVGSTFGMVAAKVYNIPIKVVSRNDFPGGVDKI